jgi:DNA-directed RNA polymerase specialized sigma24 family protein
MTPKHSDDSLPDFNYILKLVKRILPNGYDHESITGDLVLRAIERGHKPTYRSIKNFCYSAMRRTRSENRTAEALARRNTSKATTPDANAQGPDGTCAAVVRHARLDPTSRQILIYKYWSGRSDLEISKLVGLPVYRVTELRNQALIKLREAASILFPREE